tara:strand:- start:44022 stop:44216 length:195 start_codon:yes stop_codon:yes gene_type:complete
MKAFLCILILRKAVRPVSKDERTSLIKIHYLLTNPADNAHQEIAGKSSLLGAGRERKAFRHGTG